jgi:transposase
MQLIYLLAYSPDLNPIKEAFSAIKAWLWAHCGYVLGELKGPACNPYTLIWEAVYGTISPEKVYSWYKHSEYIA